MLVFPISCGHFPMSSEKRKVFCVFGFFFPRHLDSARGVKQIEQRAASSFDPREGSSLGLVRRLQVLALCAWGPGMNYSNLSGGLGEYSKGMDGKRLLQSNLFRP